MYIYFSQVFFIIISYVYLFQPSFFYYYFLCIFISAKFFYHFLFCIIISAKFFLSLSLMYIYNYFNQDFSSFLEMIQKPVFFYRFLGETLTAKFQFILLNFKATFAPSSFQINPIYTHSIYRYIALFSPSNLCYGVL